MKYSVLDMTQQIMSSLNSDEINSIFDTVESRQVADIIRSTHNKIITRANLPEHNTVFQLQASTEGDLPVVMYVPDSIARVDTVKYDIHNDNDLSIPNYLDVYSMPLENFLLQVNRLSTTEPNVGSFTLDDMTFFFQNDRGPCNYTIINDRIIIFDSYDDTQDTTLQMHKTLCTGLKLPGFEMRNDFIPSLDDYQFELLIAEAKTTAFFELKQTEHPIAARDSRRGWSSLQKNKGVIQYSDLAQLPDFGRLGKTGYSKFIRGHGAFRQR